MTILFAIIGALFLLAISSAVTYGFVKAICDRIQDAKDERMKQWIYRQISEVDRWCGYEFPEIEYWNTHLRKAIENGWCNIYPDSLREELRAGKHKRQEQP